MSSLLTTNHHVNQVNNFIDDVSSNDSTYYVFAARHHPWVNANGVNDDSAVQTVNNSINQTELDIFDELLFGKRVEASDVNHIVPRYNWVSNTVYARYDQTDSNLHSKNFFVVTSDVGDQYNVYKCIDNNGGLPSTIKPSLQNVSGTFETGDGYLWKYMYTIDSTSNTKFTSTNYIPVSVNNSVRSNAVVGSIDSVKITSGGSGYSVYETGQVQAVIDRSSIKLSNTSSSLNNYYTNSSIYLKSGFGSGQIQEISSYDGTSKVVTLASPIDVYTRFDLVNTSITSGGASVGETIIQQNDLVTYTQKVGYFSAGSNSIQSDTGILSYVEAANTNTLTLARYNLNASHELLYPIRPVSDTGTSTPFVKARISNSSNVGLALLVTAGSGYSTNPSVTITGPTGSSGASVGATALANGRISSTLTVSAGGSGYTTEPTVVIDAPANNSFNANTAVTAGTGGGTNSIIALTNASRFLANDVVTYFVSAGNTVLSGLSNNTNYFIQFANASHVALANTLGGSRITLTKGLTETGHFIRGERATARALPIPYYAVNAVANAFTLSYSNNEFIRIGEDANTNIRRIMSVNATTMIFNTPVTTTINSANTFKMNTALEPSVIAVVNSSGIITNSNIDSRKLTISNISVPGGLFIVGERADFVDFSNTSLGANGIVAFTNSSVLFLTAVNGTWTSGQRVRGVSSNLTANVVSVDTNPNVTIKNPNGNFVIGRGVKFISTSGSNTGIATLSDVTNLTQDLSEYTIGPTVKIIGDGNNAVGVATVNTSVGSGNNISKITMLDVGSYYTEANVTVYSNTSYGSGFSGYAIISPITGHGSDPAYELGGRYLGLNVKFNTSSNENWYLPSDVSIRKFGIIKDPKFANVYIGVTSFDRVRLTTNNITGWISDEIVVQNTSNAAGIVTFSNSTTLELKNVKGTFVTGNTIYGYSSNKLANVTAVATNRFSGNNVLYRTDDSTVLGTVQGVGLTNTAFYINQAGGKLANNLTVYSNVSNSYATINSISTADGRNVTQNFGVRFNQLARLVLSANTKSFLNNEYITQQSTNASGRIATNNKDLDVVISSVTGTFSIGDTIYNSGNTANAKIISSNSSYLKLTGVSNTSQFVATTTINNGLGSSATISNAYSVLTLSDVSKNNYFSNNPLLSINGANSGAVATCLSFTNPDLVRESGKVLYIETSNTVVERAINSTEEIRLIIKL